MALKASVTVCTQDDVSLLCIHTTHPPAIIRSLEEKRLLEIFCVIQNKRRKDSEKQIRGTAAAARGVGICNAHKCDACLNVLSTSPKTGFTPPEKKGKKHFV